LVKTGISTIDIPNYSAGSHYWLFNWNSLTEPWTVNPLSGDNSLYYIWNFQTIQNVFTGYLDFYFSGGWNGDDSNIQSGITNNFVDVLESVNS
jgi:hypothetical protein